jgi:hypothetical protein
MKDPKEGDVRELGQLQLTNVVSAKLEECNYKEAVRIVCSNNVYVPQSLATLQCLILKHPTHQPIIEQQTSQIPQSLQ